MKVLTNVRPDPSYYRNLMFWYLMGALSFILLTLLISPEYINIAGPGTLLAILGGGFYFSRQYDRAEKAQKLLWWEKMSDILLTERKIARQFHDRVFVIGEPPESAVGEELHMHIRFEDEAADLMWRFPEQEMAEQFK